MRMTSRAIFGSSIHRTHQLLRRKEIIDAYLLKQKEKGGYLPPDGIKRK